MNVVQWHKVDSQALNLGQTEQFRGAEIKVFVSPYDIPEAVSGGFDPAIDRFVIAFKYLNEERTYHQRQDDVISLRLGKNSGRIWAIEVDTNALGAKHLSLELQGVIDEAINRFAHSGHSPMTPASGRITRDVISLNRDALFSNK